MKFLFSIVVLFCLSFHLHAQELVITYKEGRKERVIKVGQRMLFKINDEDGFIKGKISAISNDSILMYMPFEEEDILKKIALKDIYSIKKIRNGHKVGQGVGSVLLLGGLGTILEAPMIAGEDGNDWLVRGIGAGAILVGLIPFIIKPTEYIQGKNAQFSIR